MCLRGSSARQIGRVIPNPPRSFLSFGWHGHPPRELARALQFSPASTRAFTLLEILLALALIALLAGALIGGSSALLTEKPVSADDVFWSTVQAARKAALNSQQDVSLRYDEKAKAFTLTGPNAAVVGSFPLPNPAADLLVEFLSTQRTGGLILLGGTVVETEPLTGGVTFYSDGTCTAFRLQIRVNGGAHIIAIDPWTCSPVITPPKTP
jgi:prepilin-type N-terminal cleavage/methylation domain-containing protein